ncbi:MAG: tail fiber protein [Cytophagaceae bacterium]|nr:tail fiber protein [Cytophagaceae bacterium]
MKVYSLFRRAFLRQSLLGMVAGLFATRASAKPLSTESMSAPLGGEGDFIGQLSIVAFGYAPRGYALCNGQVLLINQNAALFSLLGTTYGGNGTTNFALPDFRGRMPLGFSATHPLGERFGASSVTLAANQIPSLGFNTQKVQIRDATGTQGTGLVDGGSAGSSSSVISNGGSATAHTNLPPYLTVNIVIALQGIFPSRN